MQQNSSKMQPDPIQAHKNSKPGKIKSPQKWTHFQKVHLKLP